MGSKMHSYRSRRGEGSGISGCHSPGTRVTRGQESFLERTGADPGFSKEKKAVWVVEGDSHVGRGYPSSKNQRLAHNW